MLTSFSLNTATGKMIVYGSSCFLLLLSLLLLQLLLRSVIILIDIIANELAASDVKIIGFSVLVNYFQ